jgi:hypothetical protein
VCVVRVWCVMGDEESGGASENRWEKEIVEELSAMGV